MSSIQWSLDDLKLVSCADNGSLYEWDISTGERVQEVVVKTCSFSYLTLSPDSQNIYAVGTDKTVKQVAKSAVQQEIDLHSFQVTTFILTASCLPSACPPAAGCWWPAPPPGPSTSSISPSPCPAGGGSGSCMEVAIVQHLSISTQLIRQGQLHQNQPHQRHFSDCKSGWFLCCVGHQDDGGEGEGGGAIHLCCGDPHH